MIDEATIARELRRLEVYVMKSVNEVFAGNYKSAFRGSGMEVAQLREYMYGDDVKHIDWNASARSENVYVREFQDTRELTTYLLIDCSMSMQFGTKGTKAETALATAAILLYSALRNNDAFGVIVYGSSVRDYIPAKKGYGHFWRIMRTLIRAFGSPETDSANHVGMMDFFNRVVGKQSISFLISDEIDERMRQGLRHANTRHDFVFVNVFDMFERSPEFQGAMNMVDLETGDRQRVRMSADWKRRYIQEAAVALKRLEDFLGASGIDVVHVETGSDVYIQLLLFFRRRQQRWGKHLR